MDIMAKIEEVVDKLKSDNDFAAKFSADPVKAIEDIIGVDLPDGQINALIDGVKTKISLDADGLLGTLKKLF